MLTVVIPKHKHSYKFLGALVGNITMVFQCKYCNQHCHINRFTWNYLIKGRP